MNRQEQLRRFWQMVQGDVAARQALSAHLSALGARAEAGDRTACKEVEELIYDAASHYVEQRMKASYPYLVGRHSVASVLHVGWARTLGTPVCWDDPVSLCLRICHLVHYAFLDILKKQKVWDARHHGPRPSGAPGGTSSGGFCPDRVGDPSALDPSEAADWSEFHQRIEALPERTRIVFLQHHYLEMSFARIAEEMGMTLHEVRCLWRSALERLAPVLPNAS